MNAPLICPVHGVPMEPPALIDTYGEKYRRGRACPICTAKAFARIQTAKGIFRRNGYKTSANWKTPLPPAPTVMMPRD